MSTIGPKVLVKFEVKEREEETFISRAEFYDFKYNSFAGDLLPFNNKDKVCVHMFVIVYMFVILCMFVLVVKGVCISLIFNLLSYISVNTSGVNF